MTRPPLDVREWLEDMRRFAGRDATRADELLARLDEGDAYAQFFELATTTSFTQKTGNAEVDELLAALAEHEALVALLEQDPLASELGAADPRPDQHLQAVLDKAREDDAFRFAVQDLLIEAGVLSPHDYTTDPLPLLRMFLPV